MGTMSLFLALRCRNSHLSLENIGDESDIPRYVPVIPRAYIDEMTKRLPRKNNVAPMYLKIGPCKSSIAGCDANARSKLTVSQEFHRTSTSNLEQFPKRKSLPQEHNTRNTYFQTIQITYDYSILHVNQVRAHSRNT
jgi:hypothetical protein